MRSRPNHGPRDDLDTAPIDGDSSNEYPNRKTPIDAGTDFYRSTSHPYGDDAFPGHDLGIAGVGRLIPVLLVLAIIGSLIASVGVWLTLGGTGPSVTRSVLAGGGLATASAILLLIGWVFGRNPGISTILFGDS